MNKIEKLEKEYYKKAIIYHGTFLLDYTNALSFLEAAQTEGMKLLGFDGFWIREKGIQPDMEHSFDYSSETNNGVADRYSHAKDFIQERAEMRLYYEFVFKYNVLTR